MPATRRSARVAGGNPVSSPHTSPKGGKTGTKRKADESPKGKSSNKKLQTTIEESMPVANDESQNEEVNEEVDQEAAKAEAEADGPGEDNAQTGAVRDGDSKVGDAKDDAPKDAEMKDVASAKEDADASEDTEMKDSAVANDAADIAKGVEMKDMAGSNDKNDAPRTEENADPVPEKASERENDDAEMEDQGKAKEQPEISADGDAKPNDDEAQDQAEKSADGDAPVTSAHAEDESKNVEEKNAFDQNGHHAENDQNGHHAEDQSMSGMAKDVAGDLVEDPSARDKKVSSNIVEKGIIYFFTRERVGVEHAEGAQDLQRTYFVMRPIPKGAKLGDGPLDDSKTNRLLALPKKVFPKSGKDRFMAFVEKGKTSMSELREEFFKGGEYNTQTMGTRENHSVTPIGEGVYAITEVGRSAHLAYMLTIPREPGQVQEELGLREKGSFVLSLKNPNNRGPANAQLPEKPDFPQDLLDDFAGLAWKPVNKPEYLDYPNAQLLLIGEGPDAFGSAVEASEKDQREGREDPQKELETLESEDEVRVEALDAEDAVFADLHISKAEYPSVQTTW